MSPSAQPGKAALLLGIAAGLLALAAGVGLATAYLPEWRAGSPQLDAGAFRQRYRELAARAGFALQSGEPRIYLTTGGRQGFEMFRPAGDDASHWLLASRTAVRVEVFHPVQGAGDWPAGNFSVAFSLDGKPQLVSWWNRRNPFDLPEPTAALRLAERLVPLVLQPGETLGARRQDFLANAPRLMVPVVGASPPQHLVVMSGSSLIAGRRLGTVTDAAAAELEGVFNHAFTAFFAWVVGFLLVAGLFLALAVRARLSVVNGALLALVAMVTLNPAPTSSMGSLLWSAPVASAFLVWIFLLWSSAESLLRSTDPSFTTSLDALRTGRLGPRGGRALLLGIAFGAGVAGLHLALLALAEAVPGVWPTAASMDLPLFSLMGGPVANGISRAAGVALALALTLRVLPLRWAPVAAAVAAAVVVSPVPLHPFPAGLAAGALVTGLLVYVARRHGLTALLTATVLSGLLPAAVFSALHRDWMIGALAATAAPPLALALLGWIGLSRSAAAEVQRLTPPGFVRRLEEERRLKHEMSLLARMQRGLLPRTLPRLEGYELAARSVIANEAGGDLYDVLRDEQGAVWLAAGDVAGHGYSCAIAQAMTKAALASLIGRGRTPAEVLHRMDRVLRAAGAKRNFTSLALLRLQPESGEAVLSNAGYPYPLLIAGGEARELTPSNLPLGQGPERVYVDLALRLAPGNVLVFCSDGLFEAADGDGSMYGFDRPRQILALAARRDAGRVLEALMTDWNHHLRGSLPLDDTTVVVLKRNAEAAG